MSTSRIVAVVDAMKTLLSSDATLAGWFGTRMYTFRNPISIEQDGNGFPYLVVDVQDIKTTDADNIRQEDMARRSYPLIIFFTCSADTEELCKRGTVDLPGIYDIEQKIFEVMKLDLTLGGLCRKAPGLPAFQSTTDKSQSGQNWLGRGLIIREYYQDISKL